MVVLTDVKIPNNCHDCDACGISDVVGLNCPCDKDKTIYSFEKRPDECPLKES